MISEPIQDSPCSALRFLLGLPDWLAVISQAFIYAFAVRADSRALPDDDPGASTASACSPRGSRPHYRQSLRSRIAGRHGPVPAGAAPDPAPLPDTRDTG